MKLMSFRRPDGTASWGIVKGDGVIDLGSREPPEKPVIFTCYPNSQGGHGAMLERPDVSVTFD